MAGTFLRSATGLLREFGVVDAIWINLGLVGIFFSLTFIASTAPLTGGDPLFGGLMSLVFMFFVALAFSIVSFDVACFHVFCGTRFFDRFDYYTKDCGRLRFRE